MTPEENNDKPERPRIRLVCVAKTHIEKVNVGLVFREVTADGLLGSERIYSQKSLKHIRVGAVYEVEIDAEKPTSIYPQTMRWLRLWENKTEAAVLLEPIREEYRKTNGAGRLALEVRVLAYLRRVTISEEPQ